jgi:hypothetical protein
MVRQHKWRAAEALRSGKADFRAVGLGGLEDGCDAALDEQSGRDRFIRFTHQVALHQGTREQNGAMRVNVASGRMASSRLPPSCKDRASTMGHSVVQKGRTEQSSARHPALYADLNLSPAGRVRRRSLHRGQFGATIAAKDQVDRSDVLALMPYAGPDTLRLVANMARMRGRLPVVGDPRPELARFGAQRVLEQFAADLEATADKVERQGPT